MIFMLFVNLYLILLCPRYPYKLPSLFLLKICWTGSQHEVDDNNSSKVHFQIDVSILKFLKEVNTDRGRELQTQAGGWGKHCWCEHFLDSSNHVLGNHQFWLLGYWKVSFSKWFGCWAPLGSLAGACGGAGELCLAHNSQCGSFVRPRWWWLSWGH